MGVACGDIGNPLRSLGGRLWNSLGCRWIAGIRVPRKEIIALAELMIYPCVPLIAILELGALVEIVITRNDSWSKIGARVQVRGIGESRGVQQAAWDHAVRKRLARRRIRIVDRRDSGKVSVQLGVAGHECNGVRRAPDADSLVVAKNIPSFFLRQK